MTEVGEFPKQTETINGDDKVKCKVNQCFRMKYWSKLFTKKHGQMRSIAITTMYLFFFTLLKITNLTPPLY